jgi:DNA-binding LacI/PurR family transcriptional regulator
VHDVLRQRLTQLAYGQRFSSISEICSEFEVSSITAIRVLNELAQAGLIEKQPGIGHVVRTVGLPIQIRIVVASTLSGSRQTLDPVIKRLLDGVGTIARQRGLSVSHISAAHLHELFPRGNGHDGFLIFRQVEAACIRFLKSHQLPYVLLDPLTSYKDEPHVRVNRVRAGYLATRHLLDLGHRRIAWITGALNLRNFRQRLRGHRLALTQAGLKFDWNLIECSEVASLEHHVQALDHFLRLEQPPTAIITGDDFRALQLLSACRARGLSVPGDLSIVGYPNYPESSLADPPLTVVDARFEQVGEAAVNLLLDRMLNRQSASSKVQITPQLVVRGSSREPNPSATSNPSDH